MKVTSLEAASAASEDYKIGDEKKSGGVELERSERTRPPWSAHICLRLEARGYIS